MLLIKSSKNHSTSFLLRTFEFLLMVHVSIRRCFSKRQGKAWHEREFFAQSFRLFRSGWNSPLIIVVIKFAWWISSNHRHKRSGLRTKRGEESKNQLDDVYNSIHRPALPSCDVTWNIHRRQSFLHVALQFQVQLSSSRFVSFFKRLWMHSEPPKLTLSVHTLKRQQRVRKGREKKRKSAV